MRPYRRICTILLVTLLGAAPLAAADLTSLLQSAVDHDPQLRVLKLALEQQQLTNQKANLASPLKLQFGTGSNGVAVSQTFGSGAATTFAIDPAVTLNLGESIQTNITASSTFQYSVGDSPSVASKFLFFPSVSVSQPLNPLLGLMPSKELTLYGQYVSLQQLEAGIVSRELAIRKSVVAQLEVLIGLEESIEQQHQDLSAATLALDQAKSLGLYSEASSDYKTLEFNIQKGNRALQLLNRKKDTAWKDLENLVGMKVAALPENISIKSPTVPDSINVEQNETVYLAELSLEQAKKSLNAYDVPFIPQYATDLSYSYDPTTTDYSTQVLTGTFKATYKNFTFWTTISGGLDKSVVTARFGVDWSLPDNRANDIGRQTAAMAVETASLQVEQAKDSANRQLESLKIQQIELENRAANLQANRTIAQLQVSEAKKKLEIGLVHPDAVTTAEWNLKKLDYDQELLELDNLNLSLDLTALVGTTADAVTESGQ